MANWIIPELKIRIEEQESNTKIQSNLKQDDTNSNIPINEPNYLLIDGALWQSDLESALLCDVEMRSLYRGNSALEMWNIAPYLFETLPNQDFVKWVSKKIKMEPEQRRVTWLNSNANIDSLRKHLRRFLRVKHEKGEGLYFRFYDPIVLHNVLPNLTEIQLTQLFKEINFIEIEDYDVNERIRYSYNDKLVTDIKPLKP